MLGLGLLGQETQGTQRPTAACLQFVDIGQILVCSAGPGWLLVWISFSKVQAGCVNWMGFIGSQNHQGGEKALFARLMETQIWCPLGPQALCGRAQQRNNGTCWHFSLGEICSSSLCPESRQFSSSPYVSGIF